MSGFAAGLDATSAFFIFPAVRDGLAGGDAAAASWLLTIVGIVSAAVLLQAGRLADRFGHNRILVVSSAAATCGALLAVAAPNLELLVIAKGIQSGALAGIGVSSIAILVREAPTTRLATAMGVWAFWTATSGVVGPILSSALAETVSWRLVFVAVAAVTTMVTVLAWPGWGDAFPRRDRAAIDWPGTLAAMAGLSLLVLALLEGNDWGWSSPRTIAGLVVSLALLGLVVLRSRDHPDPTIPLQVFRHRNFALSAVIGLVANIAFFGMWLALLSYATDVWNRGLIATGLLLTLMPGTMSVFARLSGRLGDAHGVRGVMTTGAIVFSVGFAVVALTVGATERTALLLPAVITAGIGMATVLPNATTAGTATLDPLLVGTGTAMIQTCHRVGGSLGSALVVVLLDAGTVGDPATHRRTLWMIAAIGLLVAALSAGLSESRRSNYGEAGR